MYEEERYYGPDSSAPHPYPGPGPAYYPGPDPGSYPGPDASFHLGPDATPYPTPEPGYGHRAEPGPGRHRAPDVDHSLPLDPDLDMSWDPAEELAFMLQDALEEQQAPHAPPPGYDAPPPGYEAPPPAPEATGTPLENLQAITAELPPLRVARRHRRTRERRRPRGMHAVSYVIAAVITVIASAVSFFGGVVAYDPLRVVALTRLQSGAVSWWPLLVYGPWLAASLSVLRAALHRRRAVHSWCVVLAFSLIAMVLCVCAEAPRTLMDVAAAALPGLASLTCFQQLVRQITLTRPPRRATPRHRLRSPEGAEAARAADPAPGQGPGDPGARKDGAPAEGPRRADGRGQRPPAPGPRTQPSPKTYVISDNRPLRNQPRKPPGPVPQPRSAGSQADSLSSRAR
ncbi:DUF2637 domain-containing protein [Streptomyces sp. NPDC004783]|uniref:DUF2637 domain-containing protein n=1 Tax=Streptomyces sp. NPDC004783 TaxID=3154459 RepID=UPI0033ADCF80